MGAPLVDVLRRQNAAFSDGTLPIRVARNLDRLAGKAVAIVAGQQVGLFGGSAYTFYKALSALRISEQLRKSGIDAVPIFWMASEDHDLAEINHVSWPSANPSTNDCERLEWTGDKSLEGRSVVACGTGRRQNREYSRERLPTRGHIRFRVCAHDVRAVRRARINFAGSSRCAPAQTVRAASASRGK